MYAHLYLGASVRPAQALWRPEFHFAFENRVGSFKIAFLASSVLPGPSEGVYARAWRCWGSVAGCVWVLGVAKAPLKIIVLGGTFPMTLCCLELSSRILDVKSPTSWVTPQARTCCRTRWKKIWTCPPSWHDQSVRNHGSLLCNT